MHSLAKHSLDSQWCLTDKNQIPERRITSATTQPTHTRWRTWSPPCVPHRTGHLMDGSNLARPSGHVAHAGPLRHIRAADRIIAQRLGTYKVGQFTLVIPDTPTVGSSVWVQAIWTWLAVGLRQTVLLNSFRAVGDDKHRCRLRCGAVRRWRKMVERMASMT